MKNIVRFVVSLALLLPGPVFAAHPLITDDSGTQGKGKYQSEFTIERSHDSESGVTQNDTQVAATLTYGAAEEVDIAVGVPWLDSEVKNGGQKTTVSGLSDVALAVKWRFAEKDGLSFALKPGITLPTGDKDKGLGAGKTGYSLFLISTKDLKPFAVHANLGYIRNENSVDERGDIWHASLAAEYAITSVLRLVADVGQSRNPDKSADKDPAYILGGVIYSAAESVDLDLGYKTGASKAEPDYTVLAGITARW